MSDGWARAEAGMKQASEHIERVDPGWKEGARQAIYAAAKRCRMLTIDDVHDQLEAHGIGVPSVSHGCTLGALMREANVTGTLERTGKQLRSKRAVSHMDMRPVWKSMVFDANAPLIPLSETEPPRMCRKCGGMRDVQKGVCVVCRIEEENL